MIGVLVRSAIVLAFVLVEMGMQSAPAQAQGLPNGAECRSASQCGSGYCYRGPGNGQTRYCIRADKNCAWPGASGYMYKTRKTYKGYKVRSMRLQSGARFAFENPVRHANAPKMPGESCSRDSDCVGGNCYPGPGNGRAKYCLHPDYNCALPGKLGGRFNDTRSFRGQEVRCMWTTAGARARYAASRKPKSGTSSPARPAPRATAVAELICRSKLFGDTKTTIPIKRTRQTCGAARRDVRSSLGTNRSLTCYKLSGNRNMYAHKVRYVDTNTCSWP